MTPCIYKSNNHKQSLLHVLATTMDMVTKEHTRKPYVDNGSLQHITSRFSDESLRSLMGPNFNRIQSLILDLIPLLSFLAFACSQRHFRRKSVACCLKLLCNSGSSDPPWDLCDINLNVKQSVYKIPLEPSLDWINQSNWI